MKPWTLYEEALGLKNCKRVSWGLSGVVLGNLVAMTLIAANFSRSRHDPCIPADCSPELSGNLDMDREWDVAISAMRGREEMQRIALKKAHDGGASSYVGGAMPKLPR